VLQPSTDELAEHEQQLTDINKASNGACLWKNQEGTA
jgi:hypothetical protein